MIDGVGRRTVGTSTYTEFARPKRRRAAVPLAARIALGRRRPPRIPCTVAAAARSSEDLLA